MDFNVDRDIAVPIRLQLRGTIEYGIACGELKAGDALPSVRDLAERVGVAPMTVSQVYAELKADGLIETRTGSGTFVADSTRARMAGQPDVVALHDQIDRLIDAAGAMGVRSGDLAALISARLIYRNSVGPRVGIAMIGLFPAATAAYARALAAQVGRSATVDPMTIEALQRDPALRARAASADLAVTFANRQREVASLLPNTKVVSLSFIPSEETRRALVSLNGRDRVAAVSRFPDFLPIMKAGVARFAPHVPQIAGFHLDDPELAEKLKERDVLVFSTGAEAAAEAVERHVARLEYRHAPDPADVERVVMPLIRAIEAKFQPDRKAS
ncbi:GntR family transcriptional regulator [Aureimonas leprariae]|uniref:GntR family transcriptional regulator n=1 Tax=Plantimonas leprariae TaxID=2615207 RepID=A0A7V7PKZ8_9HYPH|nr:GntR family transcriptional regulator [Aureimonas leprariae]KAB0676814.1 GntR family transcriptional regulator [Aureimonas leprariae]